MLPCALANYLLNRMAYAESTAWFRVQHCLKPLRPFEKKKIFFLLMRRCTVNVIDNMPFESADVHVPQTGNP